MVDLPEPEARLWTRLGAVEPVDQLPEPETQAQRQGRANVRDRIRQELLTDDSRSDRVIAEVVGCDHKTVGKVRKDVGNGGP